ncbi:Hypothetical predicted protein [Octopus vulgaris]|uniref:Uncharacterized protein n=1 Tax=Octopus vulgaris TaxID=6645 RepID=A0AA36FAL2_OCTVU|nr:Hypothetical predicted protein [Octopus vulgaris]
MFDEKMSNGGLPPKENVVDSSTKLKIVEGSPVEKTKDAEVSPAGKAEADEGSPAGKTANVAEAEKSIKTGKVAESSPSDGATKGITGLRHMDIAVEFAPKTFRIFRP